MKNEDFKIISSRTSMRLSSMQDLEEIHRLLSLEETDRYNALGIPENIEVTKSWLQDWSNKNTELNIMRYTFSIESGADNSFVGLFGLNLGSQKYRNAEVWFKLLPNFWNQGFATECLRSIIKFGFKDLGLHRIEAGCAVENLASAKVLEKCGMQKEGRKRKVLPLASGWSDNFEYAILAEDLESI